MDNNSHPTSTIAVNQWLDFEMLHIYIQIHIWPHSLCFQFTFQFKYHFDRQLKTGLLTFLCAYTEIHYFCTKVVFLWDCASLNPLSFQNTMRYAPTKCHCYLYHNDNKLNWIEKQNLQTNSAHSNTTESNVRQWHQL